MVRKHLEHIQKLDVQTRTAAVMVALEKLELHKVSYLHCLHFHEFKSRILGINPLEYILKTMKVDLVGNFFDAKNSKVMPNGLKIDFSINNTRSNTSKAFDVDFYLSTDDEISTNTDEHLGSYRVLTGIEGNSTSELYTTYLSIPTSWNQSGDYYIGMVIDTYDEVAETDETNNSNQNLDQDYAPINISIKEVDITGKSLAVVDNKISDKEETLQVDFSISNLAAQTSGSFNTDFYLSDDNFISPADTYLGTYEISPGIAGNKTTKVLRADLQLPTDWEQEGKYYLGMITDSQAKIIETNEKNNRNQGLNIDYDLVEVDFADIDLVGEYFKVTEKQISAQETFTVDFRISNQEVKASKNFEVDFYLSDNDFISDQDTYVGTYTVDRVITHPPTLRIAGNSSTEILTANLELPTDWNQTGKYYLGMIVDGQEQIIETNEKNNRNQGLAVDYDRIEIIDILEPKSGINDRLLIDENLFDVTFNIDTTEEIFASGNELFI